MLQSNGNSEKEVSASGYCTVVTGAAGGIGFAVASRLASSGEAVMAVDLDAKRLEEKLGGLGDVVLVACDVTSDGAVERLAVEIKAKFAGVKGFVHAAGFDAMAPLGMIEPGDMQRLFAVHAVFPVRFLGWMSKKSNHAPESSAVLISSLSAHEGAKGHVAYAAAKGAVEGALMPAAAELAEKGIRLNAVVLGVVETEMSMGWLKKLPPERQSALRNSYPLGFGKPGAVADAILFLLSEKAGWITAQRIFADGGASM